MPKSPTYFIEQKMSPRSLSGTFSDLLSYLNRTVHIIVSAAL